MGSIGTSIVINDGMTAALQNMTTALNICLSSFEAMQSVSGHAIDTASIDAARGYLNQTEIAVREMEGGLRSADIQQENLNASMREGQDTADGLTDRIIRFVAAYAGMRTLSGLSELSDSMTQTTARINMMNDGLQTTEELQQMIFQSAQSARADYTAAADAVAKLGNNAGSAFESSQEIVRFSELVNKQFAIAGASSQESANAFLQLTQAMGSGVLRGDELNSIFEQAPNLIQTIAGYIEENDALLDSMAKTMKMETEELSGNVMGNIRDIASEGLISADIIRAAMLSSGEEIDEQFAGMPLTWGQNMVMFKNEAIEQLQPLLDRINELANDAEFMSLLSGAVMVLGDLAQAGVAVINALQFGIQAVQPFLPYLITAGAVIGVVVLATKAWAVAQSVVALVTASSMAPIILVIAGVVAAIYIVIRMINGIAGTSISATGVIMGAFSTVGAYIKNLIANIWNTVAAFVNFFYNVWNDPASAIAMLFLDLSMNVIERVRAMASAIEALLNKIPGVQVNIVAGLDSFYDSLETAAQGVKDKGNWVEVVGKMDYTTLDSAWNTGYTFGSDIADNLSGFNTNDLLGDMEGKGIVQDNSEITNAMLSISDDTSDISDSLEITEEDLKHLMEIGERDAINRFTTAEIRVEMGGITNQVSSNMDLDGMVNYLAGSLEEQMAIMADGVH